MTSILMPLERLRLGAGVWGALFPLGLNPTLLNVQCARGPAFCRSEA